MLRFRPFKTALVLGGGGARGLAHLGVLGVLREIGFVPDLVVGTSFGAIVGATYALTPDAQRLSARFLDLLNEDRLVRIERQFGALHGDNGFDSGWRGRVAGMMGTIRRLILWNRHAMRQSLVDTVMMAELIERLIGRASFADVRIPFYAVAFDLASNADVIVGAGDLGLALRASSSVPGVFQPVAVGERLLVDGAVFQELPTVAARRLGADFVLAVDVGRGIESHRPGSAAEVLERVLALRGERLRNACRDLADVVISPGVADMHWSEFSRAQACFDAGAAATRAQRDEIDRALRRARRRSLFRRLFRAPSTIETLTLTHDTAQAVDRDRRALAPPARPRPAVARAPRRDDSAGAPPRR